MIDEAKLIKGCSKNDRKAQEQLYEHYCKKMFAVCLRYCRKAEDAEDILQEAFVKVFNNISTFRKESSLFFWIKKIVINTALNYQRSKLYLYPMVDVSDLHYLSDKEFTLANIHYNDLLSLLQSLPDGCRIIFNLYAIEGYQHKEIAEMLGISIGTSKSQYSRAKYLLKEKIVSSEKVLYEKLQQKL
ncbi:RNA polymerase sigma factor [Chondrinema litorale]|uniref:RNA polymerase sigma factor n=1 Tax=Chondrinema litorale TaxID=2994555 RepID=UPI000C6B3604|nr:RNA polymerase sigma factor [Chondrinema litorale]MBT28227.1 RNA polymerase subunit sigma-24 [Thalassovita sp.]UZR92885.1 RNA polymerase sigma factor [Chondrinema litorale]